MIIHQIFIEIPEVGYKDIPSNPIWLEAINENIKRGWETKIWYEEDIDELIDKHYKQYKVFMTIFPNKFWKIDFCRALILHHEGGIYMDLDTILLYPPNLDEKMLIGYFTKPNGDIIGNNDFIYFKDRNMYLEYADWCMCRQRLCMMPFEWKARRHLHIVGSKSLVSFVKHKKMFRQFTGYKRGSEASWLKVYSKKRKKNMI
jgi:hypothetical protein